MEKRQYEEKTRAWLQMEKRQNEEKIRKNEEKRQEWEKMSQILKK